MPRKILITSGAAISRPQRNTRAKKVFDPSDNYIPKRRNKTCIKSEKSFYCTNKDNDTKLNNINTTNESLNYSLKNLSNVLTLNSESSSTTIPEIPKILREEFTNCSSCLKICDGISLISCSICLVKIHKDCLIVNEPMWKFKLEASPWLCKQCRDHNCSKCLRNGSQLKTWLRCFTCKVGLHVECYESYESKPLHTLKDDMYVCIPCMTLATQRVPEEDDDEDDLDESQISYNSSSNASEDSYYSKKIIPHSGSALLTTQTTSMPTANLCKGLTIPDVTEWNKHKVYKYLVQCVSQEIASKIIDNEIDGRALLLIQRSDVTNNMGLKLGPAMKLYKQIRILQTHSTYNSVFWE
ncbi:uncharacterized protein LOC126908004 isoform X2 [Daktulosphaira vitifoliae]|nr:uncharacterized protein LOC126908004 isoform X2 [Daktulosphaira vitifoliae]XP_050545759.1 uncharacterized protein LOC126908004 isoform X2 [Daktulosphaira vitifoliae]